MDLFSWALEESSPRKVNNILWCTQHHHLTCTNLIWRRSFFSIFCPEAFFNLTFFLFQTFFSWPMWPLSSLVEWHRQPDKNWKSIFGMFGMLPWKWSIKIGPIRAFVSFYQRVSSGAHPKYEHATKTIQNYTVTPAQKCAL